MSLNRTGIEWTDFTWNPVTGCFNGCPYCYARDLAYGRLKKRYLANPHTVRFKRPGDPGKDPFWPRFWKDRLSDPGGVRRNFRSRNPNLPAGSAMIFTVDMGDLFGPWVPETWRNEVLEVCEQYPKHIFQFLTKFPRELKGIKFPPSSWVGTTVTNVDSLINVNSLIQCDARIKFVSFEPLLEDVLPRDEFLMPILRFIDWVIVGALTGPGRKKHFPEKEWVNSIIRGARVYKLPVFIKDNLLTLDGVPTGIEKLREYPTCKFCWYWETRCSQIIQTRTEDSICDWIPSRFVVKSNEAPASLKLVEVSP